MSPGRAGLHLLGLALASWAAPARADVTPSMPVLSEMDGWRVACTHVGDVVASCSAGRAYRSLYVSLDGDGAGASIRVEGGCRADPATMEARVDADAGADTLARVAERLIARKLRTCEDVPARPGFLRSLRAVAGRVVVPA